MLWIWAFTLLPPVAELIFIYKMDRLEKESGKLLFKLFLFGVLISIPIVVVELLLGFILAEPFAQSPILYAFIDGVLIAGLVEETFKWWVIRSKMKLGTEYNCTFDGIVYSAFVSLGFATLENILYVVQGGAATALMRAFTSIPGHLIFSVYIGVFMGKSIQARLAGNQRQAKRYKTLSLLVPVLLHGIYDFLLMTGTTVGVLLWIPLYIISVISTFIMILFASKQDAFILPDIRWICPACGSEAEGNFCTVCGQKNEG